MSTLTTASDISIVPSTLGEQQFVGEGHEARTITVDVAAGTMRVQAKTGKPRHVFAWPVPLVPLSDLTPLLEQLLPHVRAALPGISIQTNGSGAIVAVFGDDAQDHIAAANGIIGRFHLRWTGHPAATWRTAECTGCGQRIFHALNTAGGLWITDRRGACDGGDFHRPYPSTDPRGPHQHVPGHVREITETRDGWAGTCCCGTWSWTELAPDGMHVAVAWYLHAQAIPPGAPFEI